MISFTAGYQLLLACCAIVALNTHPASAQQWCAGNQVTTGIINDATATVSTLGADSDILNTVAVNTEFKAFLSASFPGRGSKDLAIYTFSNANTLVGSPVIIPYETWEIGQWSGYKKPRLVYDGTTSIMVYFEGNFTSPFRNGLVSRVIGAGGVLSDPALIDLVEDIDLTGQLNGFIAMSHPSPAYAGQAMYLAYLKPTKYLQVMYYDTYAHHWFSSYLEPFHPIVTGGVGMAAGPQQIMVCAVRDSSGPQIVCYVGGIGGFTGTLNRITSTIPLVPYTTTSHVFVASCGVSGHFMIGVNIDQGKVAVAYTTNSGTTWSTARNVSTDIGASKNTKLSGFLAGGQCKYSFASKVLFGNLITSTSDAAFTFPDGNIETVFTTSNNYDEPVLASNGTQQLLVTTRLLDTASVSDNTWYAACANGPTGSPTKLPTKQPTNLPTKLPTNPPTLAPTVLATTSSPTVDPATCFPGDASVLTTRGLISMSELKIGDFIQDVSRDPKNVGMVQYSEVIAFMHKQTDAVGTFLQLALDDMNRTILTMTADHALYVLDLSENLVSTPAGRVKVGDRVLMTGRNSLLGTSARVMEIKNGVQKKGVYAPLTMSSSFVVENVLVSAFTTCDSKVAHIMFAPLRWMATFVGQVPECYTHDGIHCYSRFLEYLTYLVPSYVYAIPSIST